MYFGLEISRHFVLIQFFDFPYLTHILQVTNPSDELSHNLTTRCLNNNRTFRMDYVIMNMHENEGRK